MATDCLLHFNLIKFYGNLWKVQNLTLLLYHATCQMAIMASSVVLALFYVTEEN